MYDARELARVRTLTLVVTAAAWGLMLAAPDSLRMVAHCPPAHAAAMPSAASLQMLLAMHPPASLAAGWALMLVAMMSPVLIQPVHHIRVRSFADRRARAIGLFIAAYAAIWIAVGAGLAAASLAAASLAAASLANGWSASSSYLPAIVGLLIAFVWQCSPVKQRCLNRCHLHPELAAFGAAGDGDAIRFGATHGIWCAGSCWALMLFPMLLPMRLPGGHLVAMAAVTVLIVSERLEPPRLPSWRLRGLGKATRIAIAQTRMRLPALLMSMR